MTDHDHDKPFDLIVVGGGPAGLSASIFAASEGLRVALLEHNPKGVGGQSASSSLIENYYGFPHGISGTALAERGKHQAERLGAHVLGANAEHLDADETTGMKTVTTSHGRRLSAPAVVIACGLSFHHLGVPGDDLPTVFYGARADTYRRFHHRAVVVIGGGNSAGQAAHRLADKDHCRVALLVRGKSIFDSMSTYLAKRCAKHSHISIRHNFAGVRRFISNDKEKLAAVESVDGEIYPCVACFVFVGMEPDTAWCANVCKRDDKGYVTIDEHFETSTKGIYSIGDSHEHARQRIAAAVGEGSVVVSHVQQYLAELRAAGKGRYVARPREIALKGKGKKLSPVHRKRKGPRIVPVSTRGRYEKPMPAVMA